MRPLKTKQYERDYAARRRTEAKAAGLCVACRKPNDRLPALKCQQCTADYAARYYKSRTREGKDARLLAARQTILKHAPLMNEHVQFADVERNGDIITLVFRLHSGERRAFLCGTSATYSLASGLVRAIEAQIEDRDDQRRQVLVTMAPLGRAHARRVP